MFRKLFALLLAALLLFSMPFACAADDEFEDDEEFFDDGEFEEDDEFFGDDEEFEDEEEEDFRTIARFPESASKIASGDFTYLLNEEEGTASVCGYTGTNLDVVIPETLDDHPVVSIENNAFYYSTIETVTMPASMQTIGTMAFSQCASLKKVELNEGLLSIGDCCFGADMLLEEINMPESLVDIGKAAFAACTLLKEVTFGPALETIGDQAFYGCAALQKVTVPEGAEYNDNVFEACPEGLEVIRE